MPKSRSRPAARRRPASRAAAQAAARPRPTAAAPPSRRAVERRSATLLVWFSQQPKALLPLLSVALLAGGLLTPIAIAVPLLVLLLALVGWLTYLSWPAVQGSARVLRGVTLGVLVAVVVMRVVKG